MFLLSIFLLAISMVLWMVKKSLQHKRLESDYRKRNVPYQPMPDLGVTFLTGKRVEVELDKLIREKGLKVFGIPDPVPTIVVAVPELLQTVLSKEFTNFVNRRKTNFTDKVFDKILFFLEDEAWKRVRSIVAPTFSAKKLRRMVPQIQETTATFIRNLDQTIQKDGNAVDVKKLAGAFTMDTIVKTAFGVEIDSLTDLDNPLVNAARQIFAPELRFTQKIRFVLFLYFPILRNLSMKFFMSSPNKVFYNYSKMIIEEKRKKFKSNPNAKASDFIELMLEAENNDHKDEPQEVADQNGPDHQSKFNKYITEDEMIAQCMLFFFAGYDTTATTLTMSCYNLATNPDKQEKLYQEIDTILKKLAAENNDSVVDEQKLITIESLAKFEYLEAVINETLRLHPVVTSIERRSAIDQRLETSDGKHRIDLQKDDVIRIPIYSIHRDPEEWKDPLDFKPERFIQPQHHKYAHIPFGSGPRICVGKALGLTEAKIALMNTVRKYKLSVGPQTTVPPKFSNRTGLLAPFNILLKVEKR